MSWESLHRSPGKSFCFVAAAVLTIATAWFLPSPASRVGVFDKPVAAADTGPSGDSVASPPHLVGREVCQECHAENFELHAHSGHAGTFFETSETRFVEKFVGRNVDVGEYFGSFTYQTDDQGKLYAKHAKYPDPFELKYVLGSGHHGISMLSLVPHPEDGSPMGIEHRVSWFAEDDSFGVTPSQEDAVPDSPLEWLGLPVEGKGLQLCIDCHTTSAEIVDQHLVNLVANVNCEKCHGPGSEHVRQARLTKSPPPFSVGQPEWTSESEIRLCGSCHRMPKDIPRPLLRDYADDMTRFQPVGLLRSKCYLESEGQFKCTTCHNPHMTVKAKTPAEYVSDCIACHQSENQSHTHCPVSPQDDCIKCHMPEVRLEHFSFHDHWIRIRDEK